MAIGITFGKQVRSLRSNVKTAEMPSCGYHSGIFSDGSGDITIVISAKCKDGTVIAIGFDDWEDVRRMGTRLLNLYQTRERDENDKEIPLDKFKEPDNG